ncbi:MAG: hypothetical protein LLG37_01345 [Spirochaetia bacterium]|nr:hypothetical protein [Spirochaetia bacterium]
MPRAPICPVYGECGGCSLQDIEYSMQLSKKVSELREVFRLQGVEIPADARVYYKNEHYYRNRMDFPFSNEGLGQRKKGKFNKLVHFEECFIANHGVNRVFKEVNAWFAANKEALDVYNVVTRHGTLRYGVIRSSFFSEDSVVTFILNPGSEKKEAHLEMIRKFAAAAEAQNVIAGYVKDNTDVSITSEYEVIKGSDILSEQMGPVRFHYHCQGFFQSNSPVAMDIIYWLKDKVREHYDILVDFFGGVGTFGLHLKDTADRVYIIDNEGFNYGCALKNVEAAGAVNTEVINKDAEKAGELGLDYKGKKTLFVIDPPRGGMHKKAMKYIMQSEPERILYVACNPHRQAVDIKAMEEKYEMKDLAVFDMFPQTRHVETAAELVLKGKNN